MSPAVAALAGAGFGLFAAALAHALAACFWPLAALALSRGALVAGGIAALAAGVAPPAWRERLRRRRGFLALVATGAAVSVMAATGALAQRLRPEAGLGLLDFPMLYLAALAVPFIGVGVALTTWCGPDGKKGRTWFLAGIGAGALVASSAAGIPGAASSPWSGGRFLEVSSGKSGIGEISIDRGLRKFPVEPEAGVLAFPLKGGERVDVLIAGLGNGSTLARLLEQPLVHVTILGEDTELVRAVFDGWPALGRARAEGRLALVVGAERWALARLGRAFDLVVVGENWSPAAYRTRTLSHRRDYRWTVEAFSGYLALLKPEGRLLVQRNGIARVLLTLREAVGLPAADFARRVVVLGRGGGDVSECWYGAAGLDSRQVLSVLGRQGRRAALRPVYTPLDAPPGRNFYARLIRGERVHGLAFATPLDLSPPLDERPFFDHVERLMLSLRLRGMQEELEPVAGPSELRIILAADRPLWGILLVGVLLATGVVIGGARGARTSGVGTAASPEVCLDAIWRGAAVGLLIESFSAWADWLAPFPLAASAALAALLAGIGAGWTGASRSAPRWWDWAPAAALALLLGAAGYRVLPAAIGVGPAPAAAAVIVVGALLGVALGRALGAGTGAVPAAGDGTEAARCGVTLAVASLTAVAATLSATHFGYPLLSVLASVALLAPALRHRSGAAFAAGRAT